MAKENRIAKIELRPAAGAALLDENGNVLGGMEVLAGSNLRADLLREIAARWPGLPEATAPTKEPKPAWSRLRDDGNAAFPIPGGTFGDQHVYPWPGMTLRDWFAGQALVAMGTWIPGPRIADSLAEVHEARARYAFDAAAAMIAERSKR